MQCSDNINNDLTSAITVCCIICVGIWFFYKTWTEFEWDKWCQKLRQEIYEEVKKEFGIGRNDKLDQLHQNELWTDYNRPACGMPSCLRCYKTYVDSKMKNKPSKIVLLFILDSTIQVWETDKSVQSKLVVGRIFIKTLHTIKSDNNRIPCFVLICFTRYLVAYLFS